MRRSGAALGLKSKEFHQKLKFDGFFKIKAENDFLAQLFQNSKRHDRTDKIKENPTKMNKKWPNTWNTMVQKTHNVKRLFCRCTNKNHFLSNFRAIKLKISPRGYFRTPG